MHPFRLIREPRRPARRDSATPFLTRTPQARARRPTAALLGIAALLALPASAAHGMGLPRPVPPPRAIVAGDLTVSYDDGSGRPRTYDLACGPEATSGTDSAGRTNPAGQATPAGRTDLAGEQDGCRHLQEIGGPVGTVPEGQMCSMIYGGPQTADVRGTWEGHPVAQSYRRTNGCEVARWSRMIPALPNPASAPAHPSAETAAGAPAGPVANPAAGPAAGTTAQATATTEAGTPTRTAAASPAGSPAASPLGATSRTEAGTTARTPALTPARPGLRTPARPPTP